MWGCHECRSVPSVPVQWTVGARGAEKCNEPPPTIARRRGGCARGCTSLPCTSGTVRTLCPVNPRTGGSVSRAGMEWKKDKEHAHIFPAEYGLALAAIDVSHGVVACGHLTVIRFTFNNVNPAHIHPLASTPHDRAFIRSYTSSNKYARPCWPLNAYGWVWSVRLSERQCYATRTLDIIEWMVVR